MKISKLTTKNDTCWSPVTTELETIVERMRSEKDREAVEAVGMGWTAEGADRLPQLLFGGTFGSR